jgi:hypothetical protein
MPSRAKKLPSRVSTFNAWVVYLDVYGFSAKVEEGVAPIVQKDLVSVHKRARRFLREKYSETIYLSISDSTCVVYPVGDVNDKIESLNRCAGAVSGIMDFFFDRDLPIRGCACFGQVVFGDNILVGSPVLRAVELEKLLPFPLVAVPLREMYPRGTKKRSELEDWGRQTLERIVVRPDGQMYACLIFPSQLDAFGRYVDEKLEHYLTSGPTGAASGWALTQEYLKGFRERLSQRL